MFDGTFTLQRYNQVVSRILQFEGAESIGLDESGQYTMYKIVMGDTSKPPILITSGVHGQESQVIQYSLAFFEMLRDNTMEDTDFRNNLLKNFCIVYLPCLNPWGMNNIPEENYNDKFARTYYRNVNYVDINRDFLSQSQQETKNVVAVMNDYEYFAHLDLHMMYPGYPLVDNQNFVVANENYSLQHIQNDYASKWQNHTGTDVMRWEVQPERHQMVRGYSIDKPNPYTPHTLPFMTEIMRPTTDAVLLTDEEIYKYGCYSLYEFFNIAEKYFKDSGIVESDLSEVRKIVTPTGEVSFTRNSDGFITRVVELKNEKLLITEFTRDSDGNIEEYTTTKS